MPDKVIELKNIQGLSPSQVEELRKEYGDNSFTIAGEFRFLHILKDICTEPMFILLAIACSLYFILGKSSEGIMMAAAIVVVSAISFYEEVKSTNALRILAQFAEPKVTVIRGGGQQVILVNELVPGDIILLEEGMKVPADAIILQSNDLSINESIITGESLAVEKNENREKNILYQGTTVDSGKCVAEVTATGNRTELGKIGKAVAAYQPPKTLLQVQVNRFVKKFALFGLAAFVIIFIVNYLHYGAFATSLLFALTLAMSVVPEEIPVAFSSFMALGAYKMSKLGIISRQPQVIENLGSVTVLCLDKTGTITENKMQVKTIYDYEQDAVINIAGNSSLDNHVVFMAALASESDPFDPMEKAILESFKSKREDFKIEHEYPLEGHPPMMTHVYQYEKSYLAAAKGSPERILNVCKAGTDDVKKINGHIQEMAGKGYRVLGVCSSVNSDNKFPEKQDDFNWKFVGLVALYDPPKKNITEVLKQIKEASIDIKMLTGDYPQTAMNIAQQVGIANHKQFTTGNDVMTMPEEELLETVKHTSVFARMFPDAKVKVITALKKNGEIVAMTGDGVNDGPALKLADIGIAMGKKGTETAKIASDLILTDDNLEKIVIAVRGRKKNFQ